MATTELKYPDFKEIQELIGIKTEGINEYASGATYAKNDIVYRYGQQFISLANTNTGNDPISSPASWVVWFGRETLIQYAFTGTAVKGSTRPFDDPGSANYEQWMKAGKINIGGSSGKTYDIYKVHLDGTVVTGNTDLETIFDPGGAKEYPFIDLFAPDSLGTRTLLDYQGRVERSRDDGTLTAAIGETQEDAFQGHRMGALSGTNFIVTAGGGVYITGGIGGQSATTGDPVTDSTNGTPRTASETRVKSYSTGCASIIVAKEV